MPLPESVLRRRHIPDILDCLAQLSNDEVPTPPKLANAMLDLLPGSVWSEPDYRWLDPCSKTGVFLREIVIRLLDGLSEWEPDFKARREHIFRNMVYGTSTTELAGMMSRRTVYYSRNADSEHSVIRFDNPDGLIPFVAIEHTFGTGSKARTCVVCGAPADLVREGRENYAYSFIHGTYPTEEMSDMKFDVIVGNPPYQVDSDGNTRTKPVYNLFVERALEMDPRHVVMITPSRWFTGGLGLDAFRAQMIGDRRIRTLVDNPKIYDCFPGVKIRGGVSYFHWDREHDGDCVVSTRINGTIVSSVKRDLRQGDGVVVRDNRAASVVDRVSGMAPESAEAAFGPQVPFGLRTNFSGSRPEPVSGSIPVVYGTRIGYVTHDQIERNHEWIDCWKVLLPMASSGDTPVDADGNIVDVVLGEPIALAPGSACTQTYFIAGMFDTRDETENYAYYLATKFVRFLVLQRKTTQHVTPDRFRFVPMLDMTRRWTDEDLYERFGLTEDERAYIEATIKPRSVNLSLDSPIPASHLPGGSKYRPGPVADEADDDE